MKEEKDLSSGELLYLLKATITARELGMLEHLFEKTQGTVLSLPELGKFRDLVDRRQLSVEQPVNMLVYRVHLSSTPEMR